MLKMKKIKILMIISRYHPVWGGAENQLRQLIPHLKEYHCEVMIATRRWHKSMKIFETIDDVSVYRLGFDGEGFFATIGFLLDLGIFAWKQQNNFDIIHTHEAAGLGAVGRLLSWITKKPNLSKISTAGRITNFSKNPLGKIVLKIFGKSDGIICMTNQIDAELKTNDVDAARIHNIVNAVDHNRFARMDSSLRSQFRIKRGWQDHDPIVIFSGRLVHRKGADIIVKAWKHVVKDHPDAKLIILGSGENQVDSVEEEIKAYVQDNHVENVYFEGSTEEVNLFLGCADVFVLPSRIEGFPNALIEAMASECAIIASDIGGPNDIITKETGILVSNLTPNDWGQTIGQLLSNNDLCSSLRKTARNYVQENLSFPSTALAYRRLYEKFLEDADR